MTPDDIQNQLNGMVKRMLDKGLGSPSATLEFRSDTDVRGQLTYYDAGKFECPADWTSDVGVTLNLMWNRIREIPDLNERQRTNYLRKLADAVEYGKQVGIDEALINPLLEQMKKLSSNIIEHKPASDDIPF